MYNVVVIIFYWLQLQGFVRPRAIAVSPDGSTVYVSDAYEESPERIWIFRTSEYLRARRNTNLASNLREKGQQGQNPSKNVDDSENYYNIASSKGISQQRIDDSSRVYQSVYRYLSNLGSKGIS